MKLKQPLTEEQRTLTEQNLHLVRWTIREYIRVREEIEGLGFEDLCQEGALALCHAAATYRAGSVQFKTYAITVIRNYLLDHCRKAVARQKNMPIQPLDAPLDGDKPPSQLPFAPDDTEEWVSELYVSRVLEHGKRTYNGVAKLGIEALELKIKGYSGADIARLYHTKPNHVGAWISRAAEKLRADSVAMGLLGMNVENAPPHS